MKQLLSVMGSRWLEPVLQSDYLHTSGTPDTSFNGTGTNTTLTGARMAANSVAIDSSGNYVTAGVSIAISSSGPVTALVRYLADGTPDSSFGSSGVVTTQIGDESDGYAIALQSDGQIVVAGFAEFIRAYRFCSRTI